MTHITLVLTQMVSLIQLLIQELLIEIELLRLKTM